MAEDTRGKSYADQVDEVVRGFVQVWIKFGALMPGELATVKDHRDGIYPESGPQADANYEFFFRVSSSISWSGNPTMGEMSNALAVPLSTATRIVDWLVERDYAQRSHDTEDRRVVRVALTEKGKELHRAIEGYIKQRIQQVLSSLTAEEQTILFALLRKVVASLREVAL